MDLFPGLNRQRAGIGHAYLSHLVNRGHRTVIVDHHVIEQTGGCTAGADLDEVLTQAFPPCGSSYIRFVFEFH